jgi:putative Mn2+ efflux pump MntP
LPPILKSAILSTFTFILILTALSSEAFSGIYLNGFLRESATRLISKIRVVAVVTLVNVLMMSLGFLVGIFLNSLLEEYAEGLSLGILFILGLKIIIKSFKPKFREMTWELTRKDVLLGFSVALGVNAFLLGMVLPVFSLSFITLLVAAAVVFFLSGSLALILGAKSSRFLPASRFLLIGGTFISGCAIYFIFENFNLL